MPIFVDGVEIAEVWVDGVQMDSVYADGVQVFSAFSGEDYADTFVDANGTLTVNHTMNTGQSWAVTQTGPAPTIRAGQYGATGNSTSSQSPGNATTISQVLRPIVDIINPSFVASASATWNPTNGLVDSAACYWGFDTVGDKDTYVLIQGILGAYNVTLVIDGVADLSVNIALPAATRSCDTTIMYDGVDLAAFGTTYIASGASTQWSISRRSAGTFDNLQGRAFSCNIAPFLNAAVTEQLYNIHEEAIPPADIPWP